VLKCPVNPIPNPNPVYSHTQLPESTFMIYLYTQFGIPSSSTSPTDRRLITLRNTGSTTVTGPCVVVQSAREIRGFLGRDYEDYRLRDMPPCRLEEGHLRFGGICCVHLKGTRGYFLP
jgi:hypothetical protein